MGLLDEAIREHLELKRRSGADPGDIARAEHEALEPIFPVEPSESTNGAAPQDAEQHHMQEGPPADGGDFSNVGQETAELDMEAVLNEGMEYPPAATSTARPVRAGSIGDHAEQESMGWEESGEAERRTQPEEVPGQERMSFE